MSEIEINERDQAFIDLLQRAKLHKLSPGDTLVVHLDKPDLSMSDAQQMIERFEARCPNNKVAIVLADSLEIRRPEEWEPEPQVISIHLRDGKLMTEEQIADVIRNYTRRHGVGRVR